jgi:DNA mismatch endonuclease (patch repair protein)
MADVVDKSTRSRMMSGIRGKNTKPERVIRSALHSAGFRYRVHVSDLPGKPDLVFPKYKAVILVHGCFWHRHSACWWSTNPSSNSAFWSVKFDQNVRRDAQNIVDLKKLGWRVAVIWECALRLPQKDKLASAIGTWLESDEQTLTLPKADEIRPPKGFETKPTNGVKRRRGD